MSARNSITLIGRLTRDPELKKFDEESNIAKFCIAVDGFKKRDGSQESYYFDCDAWRNTGENIAKYFSKGDKIAVSGEMTMRSYTDSDGKKRNAYSVKVDSFEFLQQKKQGDGKASDADDDELPV
jgi:single-strand DNA-binding protein